MRILLLSSLFLPCLVACGPAAVGTVADSATSRSEAEALAEKYFELARARDWNSMEALYHEDFYEAMPIETWRKILPNVERELGPLGECEQVSWNVSKKAGTSFTGTQVSIAYACQHEGYEASVSFNISRAAGDSEFSIYGQNFNSLGFLVE